MRRQLTSNERNALTAVGLGRSLASNEITQAIARTRQTTDAVAYEIAKVVDTTPDEVVKFYQGNALSLWEIRSFALWKGKLPNEKEIAQILHYGVSAMQKYFK